jgi:hypothetical protein
MKRSLALGSLLPILALACAGPKIDVYERPDGTIIVESMETRATVTAVDVRAGTVTLKRAGLHKAKTFKVDSGVVDLTRVRVGDEVHATVVEELAVSLVRGGTPPEVDVAAAVALAEPGDKPAMIMADRVQVTADVVAIDGHSHQVTLRLPDGSEQTVKVAKHIDLTRVSLGDSVHIQITQAVAIDVTAPN